MELSEVVLKKTKRNAFHVVQFLRSLQDKGFIKISSSCFHFEWDLGKIQSETDAAANVASLIQCTIDRIPLETREVLKVAAFLGSRFDIRTLEQVIEGFSEINAHIQVAIDEGIVGKGRRSSSFKFAHDQIYSAAYHQISDEKERLKTHLKIGRLLKSKLDKGEEHLLIMTTEQLDQGCSLIYDEKEKVELAWLNLRAARRARAKSAFFMASMFLHVGLSLIDVDSKWTKSYEFSLSAMTMLSEMERCIGKLDDSRLHVEEVLKQCRTLDEKLPLFIIKMESLAAEGFDTKAVKVGIVTLRLLGVSVPERPKVHHVLFEYKRTKRLLQSESDDDMLASSELIHGRKLIALKIMSLLGGYAYTASQPLLIAMLGLREMKMIFRFGLSKYSAEAFATFGILAGQMGDFQLAFRYGNLASTIAAKFPSRYHTPRSLLAVHFFLWHLRKPAHESIEPLLMAHRCSMEIGDIRNAAFSFFSYIFCYLACGLPLGPIVQDTKRFRIELSDHSQDLIYLLTSIAYQTLLNLTDGGNVGNPLKLTGTAIDEDIMLHDATDTNSSIVAHNIYLQKAILANYFCDYKLAGEMAERIWKLESKWGHGCNFTMGFTYFVLGLSALGMRRIPGNWQHRQRSRKISRKNIERLHQWTKQGEPNVYHMYLILLAEEAALNKGKLVDVKNAYDQAITSAVRSGFLQNAALAEERCALFFLEMGDTDYAENYLRRSHAHYDEWGCKAKLRQLQDKYTFLISCNDHTKKRCSTFRFGKKR